MDRAGFLLCAAKLGLGSRELPSVWLAVHILGVNSTTDELTAARGPDPVPAPDYGIGVPHNGSSFLTPGNHERLLQAEARTRKALSNTTEGTKISGYERCKAMMIRRLQMGHTPQEQQDEQRQDSLEPTTLPNEVITAQDIRMRRHNAVLAPCPQFTYTADAVSHAVSSDLFPDMKRAEDASSNAPDASASHAVLSDASFGMKRAEGASIHKEAVQADNLNQLASGGTRIYTTPDLPLDLTEEEEPVTLTDISDALLASLIPDSPRLPGHLLRPISTLERKLAHLLWSDPGVHRQERAAEHMNNTHWYSGLTMDILATKLSQWASNITGSTRWLFLGHDIPNGLSEGRTYPWSRQKLKRLLKESVCWICNSGTHWYLAVADILSSTLHIYNSSGNTGNEVATKFIQSLLQYNGSFEGSNFGPTWEIVLQHSPQQRNGYDCGPFTIANCLRVVYAWDRFSQVTPQSTILPRWRTRRRRGKPV